MKDRSFFEHALLAVKALTKVRTKRGAPKRATAIFSNKRPPRR